MFYSHSLFLLLHVFFYVLCFFFFFIFFFFFFFFFFFQAEDGIRDVAVTGVQTCALPIWAHRRRGQRAARHRRRRARVLGGGDPRDVRGGRRAAGLRRRRPDLRLDRSRGRGPLRRAPQGRRRR